MCAHVVEAPRRGTGFDGGHACVPVYTGHHRGRGAVVGIVGGGQQGGPCPGRVVACQGRVGGVNGAGHMKDGLGAHPQEAGTCQEEFRVGMGLH